MPDCFGLTVPQGNPVRGPSKPEPGRRATSIVENVNLGDRVDDEHLFIKRLCSHEAI